MRPMGISPEDVDAIVSALDDTRSTEYFRSDSRPSAEFFRPRGRQPVEITRAKTRIRTAHWRNRMDRLGRPTASQVGLAMVRALVTSTIDELTEADRGLLGRTLVDLQVRGFSIVEAKAALRKLREEMLRPDQSAGEGRKRL
jgi:hypothetical protein